MRAFRRGHLFLAAVLFMAALVVYAAGLELAAAGLFFLGVVIEALAWILLLTERLEPDLPPARD